MLKMVRKCIRILFLLFVIKLSLAKWTQYDGYKVYDVIPDTKEHVQFLFKLCRNRNYLSFTEVLAAGKSTKFAVPPSDQKYVENHLLQENMQFDVHKQDLGIYLKTEQERLSKRHSETMLAFDLEDFNTLEDINSELENMVTRCPMELGIQCETYSIGQSFEGRDINMLKISKEGDGESRKAFWIDSGIHCGEWLPPATNLKILDLMTRNYSIDLKVTELLDKYDWYFMIIMNPDGYEYTWDVDRFWRKSRSPNANSECNGTDLNRNFDHMWMNSASDDPCSGNYGGSGPASEIETQVVQDQILSLAPDLVALVTLHSAAEMWLHPYGYVDDEGECYYAEDDEWMLLISNPAADAVQDTFNDAVWTRGNTCETIYPASGTTMDWAKGGAGINYTCTPELRGPYDPIPEDIDISFQEIWNGLVAMVEALEQNP